MNRITISLIFLVMISMFLPTSAIMYTSGQSTDNSDNSTGGGTTTTTDNSGSSTTDNSGSSTTVGGTTSTPTSNTNTLATTSTASDNTGNAQQQSSNSRNLRIGPCPYNENITCDNPEPINDTNTTSTPYVVNKNSSDYLVGYNDAISYGLVDVLCTSLPNTTSVQNDCGGGYGDGISKFNDPTFQQSADYVKGMLAAHNRERAAVGAPPLVWNDKLAADAKAWAEHLSPAGELVHDYGHVQGENIANNVAYGPREWDNEKNDWNGSCASGKVCGHYLAMVDPTFTSVGCGFVSYPHEIVVCRYSTGVLSQ
jgi:hypothetical protein